MTLTKIQNRFIKCKPISNIVIKGKKNTGKTNALLHRILYLINNFAYENEDNIIYISKKKKDALNAKALFSNILERNKYDYLSLLSVEIDPIFTSLEEIISKVKTEKKLISQYEKITILNNIIENNVFKYCKKLCKDNIYTIISEIKYMKNNNINHIDEYNVLMKAPMKLRKNSNSRKDMFNLFLLYNDKLKEIGKVDEEDLILYSIKSVQELDSDKNKGFVHIVIDNAEEFSKLELMFIMSLINKKSYSTCSLAINTDKPENIYSNLVKKGRVYAKVALGEEKRVFNFNYKGIENKDNGLIGQGLSLESFSFVDLIHKRNYTFNRDSSNVVKDIITEENQVFTSEELEGIPVFNNIAAGEPILIMPEQEDIFELPKYWIKGIKNKFILKVKGDSMINAGIRNGDLVIIEQTQSPNNGDIVAVNIDGNATLKKIEIEKDKIVLKPENDFYSPIIISKNDEFFVLGKAIGIIQKN